MITNLILDLDGPILDGRLRHYQCYSDILSERGFAPVPLEKYWDMKRNRLDRRVQLSASGAVEMYDQFLTAWLERIESRRYLEFDRLQPGVLETLQVWRAAGLQMSLVTMRNHRANLLWQLETLRILPLFDLVVDVGTANGAAGKAAAARAALRDSDLDSALWIGDAEVDSEAARMVGVKVCLLHNGLRTSEYLAQLHPDYLLPDLTSVNLLIPRT